MKTNSPASFGLLLLSIAGFIFLTGAAFGQQKPDDQQKAKKTYTIHVTKEVDGKTIVVDTTVVTEGDFDADAFLAQKGVLEDLPENGMQTEKHIIIRHPGEEPLTWIDEEGNQPDTIKFDDDRVIVFRDKSDMHVPPSHPGMHYYHFNYPDDLPPVPAPQFEDMMEGMMRSFGLDDVMPLGEMKQVVVKKKNHGKKVIITFEDRDGKNMDQDHGNKKEEKVIILKNGEQGMVPQSEEQIILQGDPGEKIIINKNVETKGNEKTVTVKADVDKSAPVQKEKKVIIIKEVETK